MLIVPRERLALTKNAYPTIFPTHQSQLCLPQQKHLPKSTAPEKCRRNAKRQFDGQFDEWIDEDQINSFDCLKKNFSSHDLKAFLHKCEDSFVLFYKINYSKFTCPKVVVSFQVHDDFTITVWHNERLICSNKFNWVLGEHLLCDTWSKLECLVSHLNTYNECTKFETTSDMLSRTEEILDAIQSANDLSESNPSKVSFVQEQIELVKYLQSLLK